MKWHEEQKYVQTSDNPPMYQAKDLKDPYGHTVVDPLLIKLYRKIEMATVFNVTAGCPITAGSKWILNKCEFNAFFYSFELKNRCSI